MMKVRNQPKLRRMGWGNPRPPTAFSLSRADMYERINSLFLCRIFKTTIYRQTVTNNYLLRCVITGSTGILYVIQLSDRVYNVTFPAYDLYSLFLSTTLLLFFGAQMRETENVHIYTPSVFRIYADIQG
jgi:hypothetical protein